MRCDPDRVRLNGARPQKRNEPTGFQHRLQIASYRVLYDIVMDVRNGGKKPVVIAVLIAPDSGA